MNLDDILYSTFHRLNHSTYALDKSLHKTNPNYENSFVDKFLHELNDYFCKQSDIYRLKQLPDDTLLKITQDTDDYFIVSVSSQKCNIQKSTCICSPDDIYYVPKSICDTNIREGAYKTENVELEEIKYKNFLQLKDGVYTVVNEYGNIVK